MRLWAALVGLLAGGVGVGAELPYPQGTAFPLGLYSIQTVDEMKQEAGFGWNIAHTYSMKPTFLEIVKEAGWFTLTHLAKADEQTTKATITDLVGRGPVAWWDLPEEQRWWRADEYQVVKDLSAWTRKYDPQKRPNYMYIAGHYQAAAIAKYVPYLDIIGAGTYTEYSKMPRQWVRWRIEETIRGIEQGGAKVGKDYLNGEKTPIGIPMLFGKPGEIPTMTPAAAYHDFYSCLASGARGILIFSYWHKRDAPGLQATYEAYAKAAREVSGPEGIGQALLFGEQVPVQVKVVDGPSEAPPFKPVAVTTDVCLPAVNARAMRHNGKLLVIVVNSVEQAARVRIEGLPAEVTAVRAPFEEGRSVPVTRTGLEDAIGPLGVHIYTAGGQ
ncbi:MAG: hypothetical protein ABFD96_15650 [Armatimonadia bacterium]